MMTLMLHQLSLQRGRATIQHTRNASKTTVRKKRLNLSPHLATYMKSTSSSLLTQVSETKFSRSTRPPSSGTQTSISRTSTPETSQIIRHVKAESSTSHSTMRECRRLTSSHLLFAQREQRSFLTMLFHQSSQERM